MGFFTKRFVRKIAVRENSGIEGTSMIRKGKRKTKNKWRRFCLL